MKHFEVTGTIGEVDSITIYNKKSRDLLFIGSEQGEELISIIKNNLLNKKEKIIKC